MAKIVKSEKSHAVLDKASRIRKAEKIINILQPRVDFSSATVLDIGTGAGYIANYLSQKAHAVTSIDLVDERVVTDGYKFVQAKDETIPLPDNTFDVVISNHVIEHVRDQAKHVREVMRVLKPGGVAYFATPNKYWLIDPHYRVPFINWLPKNIANWYLKTLKQKQWDVNPTTHGAIAAYAGTKNRTDSMIALIIKQPERYNLDVFKQLQVITKRLPLPLLQLLSVISPTVIAVVTKSR